MQCSYNKKLINRFWGLSQNSRGQIVVEYVLLLVIAVFIAALITTGFVSRNPNNPGILVNKWGQILRFIGADMADEAE